MKVSHESNTMVFNRNAYGIYAHGLNLSVPPLFLPKIVRNWMLIIQVFLTPNTGAPPPAPPSPRSPVPLPPLVLLDQYQGGSSSSTEALAACPEDLSLTVEEGEDGRPRVVSMPYVKGKLEKEGVVQPGMVRFRPLKKRAFAG